MIQKKITAVLIVLLGSTIAFGQSECFTIQGKIGTINDGKFIKLSYENEAAKIVDSTLVCQGHFVFNGRLNAPTLGKLSFGPDEDTGDRIDLFLSGGTILVEAKDSLSYAHISGTKLAEDHEKLAEKIRPVDREFINKVGASRNIPDENEKRAYLVKVLEGLDAYISFKQETIHQFVLENPDSYVALYHLDKTAQGRSANYETTYPLYQKLSPELKETTLGKQLGQRLLSVKSPLLGQPYKDFVSTTPDGESLVLKDVVSSNQYTLLDFWASWCGPCRKENPYVVKTYNTFKDQGFMVLSVSLDDDATRWKDAIEKDGMPWYHVSSLMGWKEPVAQLYGVLAIPQNMLIDNQGKIVATNLRGETLYHKIEQLLK